METKNLKREEKPAASSYPLQIGEQIASHVLMKNDAICTGGFDDNVVSKRDYAAVPYAPNTFSPITPLENAKVHQFFPHHMPSSGMSCMADISQFTGFPNRNIEVNSFESSTNELPQQHSYDKMRTTDNNMNHSNVEGLPQSSVRGQTVDSLHMIRQNGVKNKRNIVRPLSRQNLSDLAAFHVPINEENDGSTNLTVDAFQPNYPEQFGSFFTLGSEGNMYDRFETFGFFGRSGTRGSGTAAIVQSNTCFQNANGTSISIVGNSHSIQDDASQFGAPYQDLSGWNFGRNSPRIPSNPGLGFSPSSVLQHTQPGYQHRPSFNNSNSVNLGHHGFFNRYPSNPVVQVNNQVDFGQNRAKNLSMTSLLGRHNTQLASLHHNQETGSGCYQFRELNSEGIQRKNLSMTDLSRTDTQQAIVQQSNEAVLRWTSSAESSLIPHSPTFSVLKSRIKHDQSGDAESKMDQSSQCFPGLSLKRGSIQPPPSAPRAQRRKRVIQSPSQSNFASAINPSQPIGKSGPYPLPSSLSSTHYSAVPQLPQQLVPTSPTLALAASLPLKSHSTVPILPHRAQLSLPTTFVPYSLPKNVHYRTPSLLNTSTRHVICRDLNEFQPLGENCFLCKRDVSFTPEGPLSKPANRPPVAVLPCGHAFHDQCLERITPPEQCKSPPCIPCAVGESQL